MNKIENEKDPIEAQLQQLQELKYTGLLASSIIHSFNNAIGIIRGYADLALRTESSDDRIRAYLEQIIIGADSAKDLAEKLRVFTGQKKPDFKCITIQPVVEQEIKIFKESLLVPIDVQQDIDAACGAVLADTDQIRQILINLCNNACDALRENGGTLKVILKEVDVEASLAEEYEFLNEGKYVRLTISDTGCGIEQNILKQIYEPFFTTKKNGEVAGLGLSVVREITRGHKGDIIVESKVGEGTKFDLYLPVANTA